MTQEYVTEVWLIYCLIAVIYKYNTSD